MVVFAISEAPGTPERNGTDRNGTQRNRAEQNRRNGTERIGTEQTERSSTEANGTGQKGAERNGTERSGAELSRTGTALNRTNRKERNGTQICSCCAVLEVVIGVAVVVVVVGDWGVGDPQSGNALQEVYVCVGARDCVDKCFFGSWGVFQK